MEIDDPGVFSQRAWKLKILLVMWLKYERAAAYLPFTLQNQMICFVLGVMKTVALSIAVWVAVGVGISQNNFPRRIGTPIFMVSFDLTTEKEVNFRIFFQEHQKVKN